MFFVTFCGVAYWWLSSRSSPEPAPNDSTVVIVDDTTVDPSPKPVEPDAEPKDEPPAELAKLADSYLISVYDTETSKMPVWLVKFFNKTWWLKYVDKTLKGRDTFDPGLQPEESSSFIKYAKKNSGLDPPFIVHAVGGKVLSVVKLEESLTIDALQKIIESKAK